VKPPVGYFGSKSRVASRIAAVLPAHEHYVEPFCGSLAVLLAKPRSRMETVNDLDGDVVAFWRCLRDRPAEFERACALTPHSRAERGAANTGTDDDLERARRVWVRLTQGRGGHTQRKTGWRHYQDPMGSHSSMPEYLAAYVSRIAPAALRLHEVSLECKPALEIIRGYGAHPKALIFADPPYLGGVRQWSSDDGYAHEMLAEAEHAELLEALMGCEAAVVLCGYASELYDGTLGGWYRHEIVTACGNAARDRGRTEVLWSNRQFPQGTLFDLEREAV
jgi:DNA adenine methylase